MFVHRTALNGTTITEGDTVVFDTAEGKKGLQAVNVKLA